MKAPGAIRPGFYFERAVGDAPKPILSDSAGAGMDFPGPQV